MFNSSLSTGSNSATLKSPKIQVRERVSMKKRKITKHGRSIARLRIGPTQETFTIHEDLICSKSSYFRKILQKVRKPIDDECTICHGSMDPTTTEITFCRAQCGQNIHYDCMEKWKGQAKGFARVTSCPSCRRTWDVGTEQTHSLPQLRAKPFQCYYEWLYSGQISLTMIKRSATDNALEYDMDALILDYVLGEQIKDKAFSKAVLQALCEVCQDEGLFPGGSSIFLAYRNTAKGSPLQRLMVDMYISRAEASWFENDDEWKGYPPRFLTDLATAFVRQRTVKDDLDQDLEQLKNKYCQSEEEEVNDGSS